MEDNREKEAEIKISVRNLVEFILRSGDIDTSGSGIRDTDAMQEGSRIHRKIQRSRGVGYEAEVPLKKRIPLEAGGEKFTVCVEGRADGIMDCRGEEKEYEFLVEEIKGVYKDVARLEEPVGVHLAQAMCYGYIYAGEKQLERIGIQMTYCNLETEQCKYFTEVKEYEDLELWFENLIQQYAKWAGWQHKWQIERNCAIKMQDFPFPYREGQRELVAGVYRTILRKKKLYIEAPTGAGKTMATVFPAVKAMGEGLIEKIFYLTAKTIARTVAEDAFSILREKGMGLKVVTITAKEKICVLEQCQCTPGACERAKGHYDRVNDAVFDLLTSREHITREEILSFAEKHKVCPFEMCLDVTTWADGIICDYNYAFDPNVHLQRFFGAEKRDYVFLVDEAHNLVERARKMYSACLYKADFLGTKKLVKLYDKKLSKALEACNHDMLAMKRECEEFTVVDDIQGFVFHLMRLTGEMDEFLKAFMEFSEREKVLSLYFDVRHFLNIYETLDEKYTIYTDYGPEDAFRLTLQCMDPSANLSRCLGKGRSAVFFSATLIPVRYYMEQLAGGDEDYAVYAPSAFLQENRLVLIAPEVSTRYNRRSYREFEKIAEYIQIFVNGKKGNYFVFFPSYQLMGQVAEAMNGEYAIHMQEANMSETEKEEFLGRFTEDTAKTQIGFCVMGGIFGEGIDLRRDRLIGACIVGTGLPMVCRERELFRDYYEEKKGSGFAYAYLYNGMNKVLQSAGRVIRTAEDKGAILLLDERFLDSQYVNLFPREWFPNYVVNQNSLKEKLEEFWKKSGE